MKTILKVSILTLLMMLLICPASLASSPVTLETAVSYAPEGYAAMVYASDETGTATSYVYTVNGVDSEQTEETSFKASVVFGINEIYVTAYDADGDVIGVSDTIEIIGNEYASIQTHKLFDVDVVSPTFRTNQGTQGDVSTVVSEAFDLSGSSDPENASHGKVIHLKSENPVNVGGARNADISYYNERKTFDAVYKSGKNTMMYDMDIMPISVDKDSKILTVRYNNDSASTYPFIFKTDGTVQVATSVDSTYVSDTIVPVFDAPLEKWINMQIIMDGVCEQIILIADGVVYSSFGFDTASKENLKLNLEKTCQMSYIMFAVEAGGMGGEGKCNEFYVDNFAYKSTNHLIRYEFHSSAQKGDDSYELNAFPLDGASVVIEFSQDMEEILKEDVIFKVNGEEKDFDFSFDEGMDVIIITPIGEFLGRENCIVSFPKARTALGAMASGDDFVEFTVDFPPCAITKCETDSVVPGEYATFDVEVRNLLSDDKDGIIIVGLYKDGGLKRVGTTPAYCNGEDEKSGQVSVMIPEDYNEEDYDMIAYYVYQNSLYIIDFIEVEA